MHNHLAHQVDPMTRFISVRLVVSLLQITIACPNEAWTITTSPRLGKYSRIDCWRFVGNLFTLVSITSKSFSILLPQTVTI